MRPTLDLPDRPMQGPTPNGGSATTAPRGPGRHAGARFGMLVLLLASLGAVVVAGHLGGWLERESIEAFVTRGGAFAPLVYVVVSSLLVAAWAPRGLLSVVAGALFGMALGSVLALVMGTVGAMVGYAMANGLGADFVDQRAAERRVRVLAFVRRRGFWAVLACRVCPLVPSELISATSGAARVPFGHFLGATMLGMAPTACLYAALGASLLDPDSRWVTWGTIAAFGLLTLLTGAGLVRLWRGEADAVDP